MAAGLRLILLLGLASAPAAAPGLFGAGQQDFLHPDEAFALSVIAEGPETLRAYFRVAEGYYLYRDKTGFAVAGDEAGLRPYRLPPGAVKDDPLFGPVQTWTGDVVVDLRLAEARAGSPAVDLVANYQGCAEAGVCYPPQAKTLRVAMETSAPGALRESAPGGRGDVLSRSDRIAEDLSRETLLWSFVVFVGFGLLLAFTPCVLPMIPILAGVIAGAGANTARALRLSLVYVLAMAGTYAALGVVIGLTGANLQASMQNAWVIGGFVLVLALMALAMFGLFEFRLPAALQNSLHGIGRRYAGGGSYLGAGVMGLLGALIASPCVSPPLVGALIHIADTGGAARGAASLFGMGLGLGIPLLAFGAFEGRFMPRSGPWMVRVKGLFGVLLLALAIWMLDRVVPGQLTLALAGALLLMTGIFLRAIDALPPGAGGLARVGKGVGLALLLYGGVLLVGAATGGDSLLRPWAQLAGAPAPSAPAQAFRPVKSVEDLERELAGAKGRPALLYFYADWCVTCRELEAFTFPDPQVQSRLRRFALLKADVTANDAQDRELLDAMGLFGPPALVFYAADGVELRGFRTVNYVAADRFSRELDEIFELAE